MTPLQNRTYWGAANDCREAMKRYGRAWSKEEWEAERKQVHVDVGAEDGDGGPASSKDLSQDQLTAVLAKFRAWSKPTDLNAQFHALSQPYIRWRYKVDELLDLMAAMLEELGRGHQAVKRGPGREGYLLALARRVGDKADLIGIEESSKLTCWKVMSALMVRYDQVCRMRPGFGHNSPTRPGKKPRQRPLEGSDRPAKPEPIPMPF
jgi:hypothetical protein